MMNSRERYFERRDQYVGGIEPLILGGAHLMRLNMCERMVGPTYYFYRMENQLIIVAPGWDSLEALKVLRASWVCT